MLKKKCPACGSNDTVKILYGMPTYEAFEASERGEIELGGCCIFDDNPTTHCKTCGQNFGGKGSTHLIKIISFEFFIGGYCSPSHFVYVDGKEKKKIIKYANTLDGEDVDLKKFDWEKNLEPDTISKKVYLTDSQWIKFKKKICFEISHWKDRYFDNDIDDGTQWELIIRFSNGYKINKFGSNEYPSNWNKFMKIMKSYVDKNIS